MFPGSLILNSVLVAAPTGGCPFPIAIVLHLLKLQVATLAPSMLDCYSQKTSTRRSKEEPKTGTSMPKGKKYLQLLKGIFCNTITELVKGKLNLM